MPRRLLLDSNNFFLRSWFCVPTLSKNGEHIGGITGYFNSFQKLLKLTNPDSIIITWDGGGGSQRRRSICDSYKNRRRSLHLNRVVSGVAKEAEIENQVWQMSQLYEMFSYLPVSQFMIENVEADDVIAFLVRGSEDQNIIVSSDKDFFQLLNKNTIMYRPVENEIYTSQMCHQKFGVYPRNFVIARSITGSGDKSDGISGVEGIGWKKLFKFLPFLSEDRDVLLDEIFDYCIANNLHEILSYRSQVETNYKLMNLSTPLISFTSSQLIENELRRKKEYKKIKLLQKMVEIGFDKLSWDVLDKKMKEIILGPLTQPNRLGWSFNGK